MEKIRNDKGLQGRDRVLLKYNEKIEAKALTQLSNESAIEWLKINVFSDDQNSSSACASKEVQDIVNFCYYKRNDPSLMLALARYGTHLSTLKKLYLSSDSTIKLAVLTNPLAGPRYRSSGFRRVLSEDDVLEIIQNYPKNGQILNALLGNPKINRETLGDIIGRKDQYENLDEDLLLHIVSILFKNPVISEQRKDSRIIDPYDGLADASFNALNFSILKLLSSVPADKSWAYAFSEIIPKLYVPYTSDEITLDLLERWDIDGDVSDPKYAPSFWVRFEIAKLLFNSRDESKKLVISPEHKDKAVRLAYYNSVKPEEMFNVELRFNRFSYARFKHIEEYEVTKEQQLVIDKCIELYKLDGNDFIKYLIENKNFWHWEEDRDFLNDIACNLSKNDSGMMLPNICNWMEERMHKKHPEYFRDLDGSDSEFDEAIEDCIAKISYRIEATEKNIQDKLKLKISDSLQNESDSLIYQIENQISTIRSDLSHESKNQLDNFDLLGRRINALEETLKEKNVGVFWKWSVIILLLSILFKIY